MEKLKESIMPQASPPKKTSCVYEFREEADKRICYPYIARLVANKGRNFERKFINLNRKWNGNQVTVSGKYRVEHGEILEIRTNCNDEGEVRNLYAVVGCELIKLGDASNPELKNKVSRYLNKSISIENLSGIIDEAMDDVDLSKADGKSLEIKNTYTKKEIEEVQKWKDAVLPVPDGFNYFDYQDSGIRFLLNTPNTLLADEMGVGKTIQAIGLINADTSIKKVLIICPASLKLNWAKELSIWLTRDMSVGVIKKGKDDIPDTDIIILNYDLICKDKFAPLIATRWGLLICDEAHYLKNPKSKRTQCVLGAYRGYVPEGYGGIEADRKVMITGTPIVNRPIEIWTLANYLDPQTFPNFWEFAKRYAAAYKKSIGRGRTAWDFTGASNLDELQLKLRGSIMLRRLKTDVLKELPPKLRRIIPLPASDYAGIVKKEQKALRAAIPNYKDLLASGDSNYSDLVRQLRGNSAAFDEISEIRVDLGKAKIKAIADHVLNVLENTNKVILFLHHKAVIEGVQDRLESSKFFLNNDLNVVRLIGEMGQEDRQKSIDSFQNDEKTAVFIGSITASGVGITLTAANYEVFGEITWRPADLQQAEDRAHRIGQDNNVLIDYLVVEDTLEAYMMEIINEKMIINAKALDGQKLLDKTEATTPSRKERLTKRIANFERLLKRAKGERKTRLEKRIAAFQRILKRA